MRVYRLSVLPMMSIKEITEWVSGTKITSQAEGSPVTVITKIPFGKFARGGDEVHTGYMRNYGQGEQYAIH